MSAEKLNELQTEAAELWQELNILLKSMEMDFAKSLTGNASAATRARKGLKLLSDTSLDLRKKLLVLRKLRDELKKA